MDPNAILTHEDFDPLVGKAFGVDVGNSTTLELKLMKVKKLPPVVRRTLAGEELPMPAKRAPFSLYFRSEGEMGLRQATVPLLPPDGGPAIPIFIVPLGVENGGVVYEAIFN
jgi:hypothetical protein